MSRGIGEAVRDACLWLPGAEEHTAHGMADFRVKGRTFATYAVNHHGDGRVALWLNAPAGAQHHHVQAEPEHFFVPPYVGPRGWLGVRLDKGISWKTVATLVREAYTHVAPPALVRSIGPSRPVKPPTARMRPEEIDPLQSRRGIAVLARLRPICLALPGSSEATQFGHPVWRAGKRVFAQAWCYRSDLRLQLGFWVGVDQQGLLLRQPGVSIPAYLGHNDWIALDVTRSADWKLIHSLALSSYRHFALQRMLKALDAR